MFAEFFARLFVSDLLLFRARGLHQGNEELQKLREVAEVREATTEEKLRLEREARLGTTQRSYAMFFLSCSSAWADPAG